MKIIYSFNKTGFEAEHWTREIAAASNERYTFIPFNHDPYLPVSRYLDSVALDRLYQSRHPGLMRMYGDLRQLMREHGADALFVTNCPPYHPDFLRTLDIYKALHSTDDPDGTYRRSIPYLHAYDHVFHVAPGYSADMELGEKFRYCGMRNVDWLPLSVFDFEFDTSQTDETILSAPRDVDIAYIGHCFPQKMPVLTAVKRVFGSRLKVFGFYRLKHNLYANLIHGYGGWIRPIGFRERLRLYQRTKIGFNLHWNEFGLGNQRLYLLPANGVMQICDCPDYLPRVYKVGEEAVAFRNCDELIDRIRYYLDHEDERNRIALAGFRRVMRDYRFADVIRRAASLMERGYEHRTAAAAATVRYLQK